MATLIAGDKSMRRALADAAQNLLLIAQWAVADVNSVATIPSRHQGNQRHASITTGWQGFECDAAAFSQRRRFSFRSIDALPSSWDVNTLRCSFARAGSSRDARDMLISSKLR